MISKINPVLAWEPLGGTNKDPRAPFDNSSLYIARSKMPGGWLVTAVGLTAQAVSITFVPDPEHKWDGNSIP